jgi:hypothetical protein
VPKALKLASYSLFAQIQKTQTCQLCFNELPLGEHEQHLLEFHKINPKAIADRRPLRQWFMPSQEFPTHTNEKRRFDYEIIGKFTMKSTELEITINEVISFYFGDS